MSNRRVALFAASAAAPPSGGSASGDAAAVSEVIITAQKRSSTVQKTAISITAITAQDLQQRGLETAQAIVQAVPGIAITTAGPGQAQYEIRGLSANGGEAPTIGFYLDETSISPPAQSSNGKVEIDPDLYDLSRAEVLRGPQGTLYGAGSLGGTVKLVTNPPDFKGFYGSEETGLSGTDGGSFNYSEKAMVNLPIVADKVALRIVGDWTHNSGWIARVVEPDMPPPNPSGPRGDVLGVPASATYHGVNDEDLGGVRASLLIKPTDALTITPGIFYQHTYQGGLNAYDNPPGTTLAHYQPFDIAEPYTDQVTIYSLVASYAFKDVTVTSASSYWTRKSTSLQDSSEQIAGLLGLPGYTTASGGIGPARASEVDSTSEFSQEVRLSSNGSRPFQWIIGGFYSSNVDSSVGTATVPALAAIAGTTNLFTTRVPQQITQEAGFIHASYQFDLGFKLEGGARYFVYNSAFSVTGDGYLFGTPTTTLANASASGINPMVNLSWSPNAHFMTYASASKGFREGAGNTPTPTTSSSPIGQQCLADLQAFGLNSAPTSYAPDSVWSYEVGEKARLFNGGLIVNSDVYYIVWSKVQTPVALSCGSGFIANGPDAEVRGGETEVQAKLAEGLTVSQSVGYSYSAYGQSYAPADVTKGQVLFDAPRWTLSTRLSYEHPLGPFTFVSSLQNSFQSTSYDVSYQVNRVPSRDLTNLRVGLETTKWSIDGFVDNVFNVHAALQNIGLITGAGPNFNRVATNQPFTAGVDVGLRF